MPEIIVRNETPSDIDAVRAINVRAFGQQTEADIVDALRTSCRDLLSLVAVEDKTVVGHILFTPVTIDGSSVSGGIGLAPMAVLPEKQRLGIESKLVNAGLEILKHIGCPFVVVLGHPQYYPRFGFVPASRHDFCSQWKGLPDQAFMVLVFKENILKGAGGIIRYRSEFDIAV